MKTIEKLIILYIKYKLLYNRYFYSEYTFLKLVIIN